jgi:hypothetical protein
VLSKWWDVLPPTELRLEAVDEELFVAVGPDGSLQQSVSFAPLDGDGRPRYLFASARMARRVE